MKKFFTAVCLIASLLPVCQANAQTETEEDLQAVAPESPTQIRLPHSERTKDNMLDIMVDYLLTQLFKKIEGVELSYRFFEIDADNDLVFSDFSMKPENGEIKGVISFAKLKINSKELISFLQKKKKSVSSARMNGVSADLVWTENQRERHLKANAEQMILGKMAGESVFETKRDGFDGNNIRLASVSFKNAVATVTGPAIKYAAKTAEIKDMFIPDNHLSQMTFSSAVVDGKEYKDLPSLLQAIKQQPRK